MRKPRHLLPIFFFLLAVLLLTSGCQSPLDEHQSLWHQKGLLDYRYELRVLCFCPTELTAPVVVEVRRGAPLSVKYLENGTAADRELFSRFDMIDKLFELIRDAYRQKADSISVTYNSEYGYPLKLNIDYLKEAVDEELAFTMGGFMPLSGN